MLLPEECALCLITHFHRYEGVSLVSLVQWLRMGGGVDLEQPLLRALAACPLGPSPPLEAVAQDQSPPGRDSLQVYCVAAFIQDHLPEVCSWLTLKPSCPRM